MNTEKHCRHCVENCPAGIYPEGDKDHESALLPGVNVIGPNHLPILWADGCCPMCAEGERIAAWCDIPRPELWTWLPGLEAVARFIRSGS